MELLIRSQDKNKLIQYSCLYITRAHTDNYHIWCNDNIVGKYKSESRAIEVLDEIQKLIKNQYIIKLKPLLNKRDGEIMKKYYENNYLGEFIIQPPTCEIHPITPNVVVYEMPKE